MENVIGSITPGKFADFAALADDPFSVEASKLGAIEVVGTISGGRNFVA
jgi:predicted amidohydrolase YtcJ